MQKPPVGPDPAFGKCAQYFSCVSFWRHGACSAAAVRHHREPSCSRCAFCRRKAAPIAAGSAPDLAPDSPSLRSARLTARATSTRIAAASALTSSAFRAGAVNGWRSQRAEVIGEQVQLAPHGRRSDDSARAARRNHIDAMRATAKLLCNRGQQGWVLSNQRRIHFVISGTHRKGRVDQDVQAGV
eukprot:scaffold33559_cov63-Phaeocystis_antarctica.AAC.3